MTEKRIKLAKKWILNAFVMNTPGLQNVGLWCHSTDTSTDYKTLKFWTNLATKLEQAGFSAIFIADVLGPYDVFKGPANLAPPLIGGAQLPTNDPQLIVPAMASVTESIGFGVTVSTTYEHPYDLARRFSTLDHLTDGRIGWNVVTSYLESAALAHGLHEQIDKETRYERADEYMDIVYKLWEGSWKDNAVILDKVNNIYSDPSRVRVIHHDGKYFKVDGVHLCEPSKQRTPLIFQAGISPKGIEFASKHAEAVFVGGSVPERIRETVDRIRDKAVKNGRDRNSVKLLAGIVVVVDETDELAQRKYDSYAKYSNYNGALALFGGWTGLDLGDIDDDVELKTVEGKIGEFFIKFSENIEDRVTKKFLAQYISRGGLSPKIIGSAETVVDELERWIEISDLDGFNMKYIHMSDSFDDLIRYLFPELRKRGHLDDQYFVEGGTLRENLNRKRGQHHLLKDHYGHNFKWV